MLMNESDQCSVVSLCSESQVQWLVVLLLVVFTWKAAILDCKVGVGGASPLFRVENTNQGVFQLKTPTRKIGISILPIQMKCSIWKSDDHGMMADSQNYPNIAFSFFWSSEETPPNLQSKVNEFQFSIQSVALLIFSWNKCYHFKMFAMSNVLQMLK